MMFFHLKSPDKGAHNSATQQGWEEDETKTLHQPAHCLYGCCSDAPSSNSTQPVGAVFEVSGVWHDGVIYGCTFRYPLAAQVAIVPYCPSQAHTGGAKATLQ